MKVLKEFKEFALRGNVVDMAVGVIIGAAFGKIVNSLVTDILMPPLGYLAGGVDFADKVLKLKDAVMDGTKVVVPAVTINYGLFINNIISFTIVAFALFMMIKGMNTLKKKEETQVTPLSPPPPQDVVLLGEIRDLLKKAPR